MKNRANANAAAKSERRPRVARALGPGLHAGTVELESGGSYRVALVSGGHVRARLDDALPADFVDECMREGRRVLLQDSARGPLILGALYAPTRAPGEHVELRGKSVRIEAKEDLALRVGQAILKMDKTGAIRLEGRKAVLDIASLVRFLSARVELP